MGAVSVLKLLSDGYSPMSAPHDLPALLWSELAQDLLKGDDGADTVEDRLRQSGWDPQWRFGMYSQAHYHSVRERAFW